MWMNCHLIAGEKTGSNPGPSRAECQGRSQSTPIGNAARCYHWNWLDGIDHCRNERHGRNHSTHMAAGFPSLSDNDVNATLNGVACLLGRAHCVKHCGTASLSAGHESGRIAPEEGYN